jgi:CubicO group peptidase (beta-lactamase class C family)
VTVITVPGSAYHYSRGGYEIAETLVADALHAPLPQAMDALVLKPAEITHSTFAQPLPSELAPVMAKGHYGDGNELPGGWRICPEHAAAGLWSTRGQNVGYQGYLILLPTEGQGLVVMTNSDDGSILAEALIRRVAQLYRWPPIGVLPD